MTSPAKKYSKAALETESFEVVVVKDPKLKPFLNTFHSSGSNIQQRRLGKIFGIIQVDDTSEGSAYLPNLLTQIIKKEYFKNKKDDCGKSFEVALRKANIALTELAQHEIVKWMNNLNVAIGVICGNEFHFTQVGKGKVLLLKEGNISEIDQSSNKNQDYHPMKTFSTISAGRIGNGNKLIFTINRTFKNLNKEEIKRHYKTFTSDEFDNIISSTLRNEASNTGMVIVNANKESLPDEGLVIDEEPESKISEKVVNFFGKEKKEEEKGKEEKIPPKKEKPKKQKSEKEGPKDDEQSPFEKEPEIYVKESDGIEEIIEAKKEASEKITQIKKMLAAFSKKIINFAKDKASPEKIKQYAKPATGKIKKLAAGFAGFSKMSFEKIQKNIKRTSRKIIKKIKKIDLPKPKIKKEFFIEKLDYLKKILAPLKEKDNYQKIFEKIKALIPEKKERPIETKEDNESLFEEESPAEEETSIEERPSVSNFEKSPANFFEKFDQDETPEPQKNSVSLKAKIKDFFEKTKNFFLNLSQKKHFKKIAVSSLVIILIFIAGSILIKKIKSQSKETSVIQQKEAQPENSTNIKNFSELISLNKKIKDSSFLRNNLFLLTEEKSLIKFSVRNNTKTEILLPEELKDPQHLSSIESLQMILIIGSEEVYSYSPVTNSFAKNKISLPEDSESAGVGTYLTYFYFLDKKSNQIYRYHRAPGGFGPSQRWLEENQSFDEATDIDVSDSIYVGFSNGKIEKYFDNQKITEWTLEENFNPDKIEVEINKEGVLALDKKQGKIIKLSEGNGSKETLQDNFMKNSQDFSVNFDTKEVFLITKDSKLVRFNYQ